MERIANPLRKLRGFESHPALSTSLMVWFALSGRESPGRVESRPIMADERG